MNLVMGVSLKDLSSFFFFFLGGLGFRNLAFNFAESISTTSSTSKSNTASRLVGDSEGMDAHRRVMEPSLDRNSPTELTLTETKNNKNESLFVRHRL